MTTQLRTVQLDQRNWDERHYRMALTIWAEPADPDMGDWLDRISATGSTTPVRDMIDQITHNYDRLTGTDRQVADRLGPRYRTPGVVSDMLRWYLLHHDASFLIPGDRDWPSELNQLEDTRPYGLWVRGETGWLNGGPRVCIDGARASTSYGEHVTMELSTDLTARGQTIVTGAAYGIEGTATRAALTAGGHPIVILASGIDRPYPLGHADLLDRVARNGAVISEIAPGCGPTKWRFLARNRLLAAMSDTVIIPEAGFRSGSLNTAAQAERLGKIVGTVPGPITSPASAGCHRLLQESDAYVITTADDVLAIM